MGKHTFTGWLYHEITASRCALLKLYEEKDRLMYMEKPALEQKYMDAVGNYEQNVIREEMECELLSAKHRMVQVKLNRREPIDEAEIDRDIEKMRSELMAEATKGGSDSNNYATLPPEKMSELQELYGKIIKACHPQMHPDLPETHRQLYDKAQEAYRRHDMNALQLIWDMLTAVEDGGAGIQFELELSLGLGDDEDSEQHNYTTDYTLSAHLYDAFVPVEKEAPLYEEWQGYISTINCNMKALEDMREEYPFTAKDMLSSPEQIAAYKSELEQRMRDAQRKREKLQREIQEMIGSAPKHG